MYIGLYTTPKNIKYGRSTVRNAHFYGLHILNSHDFQSKLIFSKISFYHAKQRPLNLPKF